MSHALECGYSYKGRLRHVYRNRLSEVSADFEGLASHKRTISEVADEMPASS
jgi:hypothetical protein